MAVPHPAIRDTIVAPTTAEGSGAIAVIRLSGQGAIAVAQSMFRGKNLSEQPSHTLHVGIIEDANKTVDEVVISLFKAPHSFTGENVVEISCHGSPFIVQEVVKLALKRGARPAEPGEFTQRAFLNGKLDLVQAEAVADLIVAETEAAHRVSVNQMRGGFSKKINALRKSLVHFASLVELELDFAEEDVEFAERGKLIELVGQLQNTIQPLIDSFDRGNAIKRGVAIVIAGKPNTGKSTLLNALLKEDKVIVSELPGTTRDSIEDEITLGGIRFRFIDTAGIRSTSDPIERLGVQRTKKLVKEAALVLYLFDMSCASPAEIEDEATRLEALGIPHVKVGNKMDVATPTLRKTLEKRGFICMSAQREEDVERLKEHLLRHFHAKKVSTGEVIMTNVRHYESLLQTRNALERVLEGLKKSLSGELLATDIRQALHHLGELTGEITTDDMLNHIFSKFCIGK